jgi:hypothetical protein
MPSLSDMERTNAVLDTASFCSTDAFAKAPTAEVGGEVEEVAKELSCGFGSKSSAIGEGEEEKAADDV